MIEQPKKAISTVIIETAKEIGTLTTKLGQEVKKVGELRKGREPAMRKWSEYCDDNEFIKYERGVLQARLQLHQCDQESSVDIVNCV